MPDFLNLSKKDVYKAPPGNAPGTGQAVFSVMQDTRVYICGVDVTSLVTSVSTRIAPITQGGNSCSINIQNPNSIFTITKRNIQGGFTLNSDTLEYNESVKKTIYDAKRRLQIARTPSGSPLRDSVEKAIERAVGKGRAAMNKDLFWVFPDKSVREGSKAWQDLRWDLAMGTPIFNTGDPIRIFYRHPYRHVIRGSEAEPVWYHGFTGYISTVSSADDLGNGVSVISITGEGTASRLLRLSRVNRNVTGYLDLLDQDADFIMGDIILTEGLTSMFTDLSLPQLLGVLIVGATAELNQYGPAPISGGGANVRGVGRFTLGTGSGGIQIYQEGILPKWQEVVHPELLEEDVIRIGSASGFGDDAGVMRSFGGFSGEAAPDTGHLHILLPPSSGADLSHFNRIVEKAVADFSFQSELETRLDIIKKYIADYLYYQVIETPSGDISAEFPFYDFTPYDLQDYGTNSLVHNSSGAQVTLTEDDNKAFTWIVVTGSLSNVALGDTKLIEQFVLTAHGILSALIPRYGIRVLQVGNPLLRTVESLGYFLKVMCARTVADIRSAHAVAGFMDPSVFPNRPYLLAYKGLLGTLTSVANDVGYQSQASTALDLNYIRMVTQDDTGKLWFLLIGGGDEASKPLAYNTINEIGIQKVGDLSFTADYGAYEASPTDPPPQDTSPSPEEDSGNVPAPGAPADTPPQTPTQGPPSQLDENGRVRLSSNVVVWGRR